MIALDTNVLARAVVAQSDADAATQAQQRDARALLGSRSDLFVPVTVLQELEWVLRSAYDMPTGDIADLFRVCSALKTSPWIVPLPSAKPLTATGAAWTFRTRSISPCRQRANGSPASTRVSSRNPAAWV